MTKTVPNIKNTSTRGLPNSDNRAAASIVVLATVGVVATRWLLQRRRAYEQEKKLKQSEPDYGTESVWKTTEQKTNSFGHNRPRATHQLEDFGREDELLRENQLLQEELMRKHSEREHQERLRVEQRRRADQEAADRRREQARADQEAADRRRDYR